MSVVDSTADSLHVIKSEAVVSVVRIHRIGVFSPITLSGVMLVVGGVQVSCYGDFKYHALSHIAMSVVRVLVDSIACMSLACRQLVLGNWRSAFGALMSRPNHDYSLQK